MKKQNLLFTAVAMLAVLFSGCSNLTEKTDGTSGEGIKVQLHIGMERTVAPSGFLNAEYTLTGTHSGENRILAENKTAAQLQSQVFWLESGTWSFTLDAYVGSTKKGTATISSQSISSSSATLSFTFSGVTFDYASGTGGTAVTLTFPKTGKVAVVTARLYNADGTENANFAQVSLTPSVKDDTLQQVTYINSNIAAGSYLLDCNLYQDTGLASKIGQWREIVNIANGCESATVIPIVNLNTLYSITYELNGLSWADGFSAPSTYNSCQGVVLPVAANFTNTTGFGGWFTTSDCSGTAVTGWTAGDHAEDLKFYAKVTREAGSVNWSYPAAAPALTWTGEGTVNNPYVIATAQQLADFSYMVNNGTSYSGNYIKLGDDIDLNYGSTVTGPVATYAQWKPIGNGDASFQGTFDGNSHTVKGIYINGACSYAGLFGSVSGSSAEVKNVCAQGYINAKSAYYAGGIAGHINATISNCANKIEIVASMGNSASYGCGGITGYNSGTINYCANCANITATSTSSSYNLNVGGIVGYNILHISDNENYGNVTGESTNNRCYVGGIAGYSFNNSGSTSISTNNNISCGVIKGRANTISYTGGIIGYSDYSYSAPEIKNNAFYGTLDGSGTSIYLNAIASGSSKAACNYYLSGCGTTTSGVSGSVGTFTSYTDQITVSGSTALDYTGTLLEVLNAWANDNSFAAWKAGSDGWPVLSAITWTK
jgi:hypothetical protein